MRALLLVLFVCAAGLVGAFFYFGSAGEKRLEDPVPGLPAPAGDVSDPAAAAADQALRRGDVLDTAESAQRKALAPEPEVELMGAARKFRPAPTGEPVVRGRVTDEFGQALEDVRVVVYAVPAERANMPAMRMGGGMERRIRRSGKKNDTETNAEGAFTVDIPAPESELDIEVEADGFELLVHELGRPSELPVELDDLALVRGCIIRGRVVDGGGAPIRGVRLKMTHEDDESDGELNMAQLGISFNTGPRTKKDGTFEFLHEPAGKYKITAIHKKHPKRSVEGEARVGQVIEVVLELPEGGIIAGKVEGLPEDSKGTIVQARRAAVQPDGETSEVEDGESGGMLGEVFSEMGMPTGEFTAKVDKDGAFELEGLELSGAYVLWAAAPGRQMFFREPCSDEFEAHVGDRTVVIPYLDGARVNFQVVDAQTGAPLTELSVNSQLGGGGFPGRPKEETHDDGRVTIDRLRPRSDNATLHYAIRAAGYRTHQGRVVITPQATLDLGRVPLLPAPVVRVRVTTADGDPVTEAPVVLALKGKLPPQWAIGKGGMAMAFAGEDLTDSEGEDRATRRAETDDAGRCIVNSLPGETAVIAVNADEFALYQEELDLPANEDLELEIVLTRGGSLVLTVVDADEYPVPKARIEHMPPGDKGEHELDRRAYSADDAGVLLLDKLAPGEHALRAQPAQERFIGGPRRPRDEDRTGWTIVDVVEGEPVELTLVLPDLGFVAGTITEHGAPLSGASIRLFPDDDASEGVSSERIVEGMDSWLSVASDTTDGDGRYALTDVAVGSYRLRVRHPDRVMPTTILIEIEEGEQEKDLDLDTTLVTGQVRGADGKLLAGAEVSALLASQANVPRMNLRFLALGRRAEPKLAITDDEGRFELRGVIADEEVVVRAKAAGHSPATSDSLRLTAGERRDDIDLKLTPAGSLTVYIEGGRPFQSVRLRREIEGALDKDESTRAAVARKGVANFEDLEPGLWRVTVRDIGDRTVEIQAGVATEASFVATE